MAQSFTFSFGRLLQPGEKLDTAKFNAIVKGIVATLTGTVANADLDAGAVTPDKTTLGAYFYSTATLSAGTYTAVYTPAIVSHTDGLILAFKAGSANLGAVSFDAGPGAKPLRKHGGVPLVANDILAAQIVEARYNSTLVAGGAWEITSQLGNHGLEAVRDSSRNLEIITTTVAAISVTADEVVLKDTNGNAFMATAVNVTSAINAGVALNGLETGGTEAASTWYYLWLISDGSNVRTVLEQATAGPPWSLPAGPDLSGPAFAGYTYKALIGATYNNTGSDLDKFHQRGKEVWLGAPAVMTATVGGGALVNLFIREYVPPIARVISGTIGPSTDDNMEALVSGISQAGTAMGAQTLVGAQKVGGAFQSFWAAGYFRTIATQFQVVDWHGVVGASYRLTLASYEFM